MHKVFESKENVEYVDREGAYLIPYREGKVGVIETDKGLFLIGGGLEKGEGHIDCLKRECVEETGYLPVVKGKIGSAEAFMNHPAIGYFHPMQTYYYGELREQVSSVLEKDHVLRWVAYEDLNGKLYAEMQNWALKQLAEYIISPPSFLICSL